MIVEAGTGAVVRLMLRRDRVRIAVWLTAITALTYLSGAAVGSVYRDQSAVDGYARLVEGSAVTVAFSGPPVGLHTQAGVVVYEITFTALVGVCLMAVLMMSRHTRAEEESGRSELLRAAVLGRHASGTAALMTTTGLCVVLGLLLATVLLPTALTAVEAALFGASVAAVGIVFATATLCLAQVFLHARTVTGAALALVSIAYAVRAAGDVTESALVWFSPIGWAQAVHVPVDNRWWPLLLCVVASAALVKVARMLADRRDFGSGLVPERPGSPDAPASLTGTLGLGWRVRRASVAAWAVGLVCFGILSGALGPSVQDMVDENPTLADYLQSTSGVSVLDSYLAAMATILALVTCGFTIWATGHRGVREGTGQAELVLAGPLSRLRLLGTDMAVVVGSTALVLLAAAVGLGITHGLMMGSVTEGRHAFAAPLVYFPALLSLVGLVTLLEGWLPRWTAVGWLALAYCAVLGWLGGLLDPPAWMLDLSPFERVPRVPEESWQFGAPTLLVVLFVVMSAAGLVGFRRRDLV